MSLSLIQGYSSAEEEEEEKQTTLERHHHSFSSSGEEDDDPSASSAARSSSYKSVSDLSSAKPSSSGLPSAFDAFSEVSGRPKFLDNAVEIAKDNDLPQQGRQSGRWGYNRKEKKELPAGAVVEAKPLLVGIHERVRSDIEDKKSAAASVPSTVEGGGKRAPTATNPNAEDAAELLRMCLQCGIPKTFSSARGMVCPVCGDRPLSDASKELKKKGSAIKDKEKNKRMKGQSSHATWKSETEMQLRQQFD